MLVSVIDVGSSPSGSLERLGGGDGEKLISFFEAARVNDIAFLSGGLMVVVEIALFLVIPPSATTF